MPGWTDVHRGQPVFDRSGVMVGRVDQIRRADPLAVADDGRRIAEAGDLLALLPGRYARRLPHLTPQVATGLIRNGYLRLHHHDDRRFGYVALTDIDEVLDDGVHLRVSAADLPIA